MSGRMPESLVAYFGYGSLVNRATLRTDFIDVRPARLRGYRRSWLLRPDLIGAGSVLLTVRPDPVAACDGVVVIDRAEHLAAVDLREQRYRRVAIASGDLDLAKPLPDGCPAFVYCAEPPAAEAAARPRVVLRSYLDAVLQGFHAVHGEPGLRRFVEETEGFDLAFHEDREAPLYPRAVTLTDVERDLFDAILATRGGAVAAGSIPG